MPTDRTSLDLLRPGVLLSEEFKLLERIPRWVAGRRFLADHSGRRVQLLFFEETGQILDAWQETLPALRELGKPAILPVLSIQSLRGFHFLVAEEVRGPVMSSLLDEEGVLLPEDAREVLAGLRDALRGMQQSGLPAPAITTETILLVESDAGLRPVLFPWALPHFPGVPAEQVSRSLRDLLYTATTNLQPPRTYSARDLQALPPPVRRSWQPVFEEVPDWTVLDDWNPLASRAQLPPLRPNVGSKSRKDSSAARAGQAGSKGTSGVLQASVEQRNSPNKVWAIISAVAALGAAAAVGWFSYSLVESLHAPSFANDAQSRLEESFSSQHGIGAPERPLPEGRAEEEVQVIASGTNDMPVGEGAPSADAPGSPGENLLVWWGKWQEQREDPNFTEKFSKYLDGLEPHTDAMRSGRLPELLGQLEEVAKDGPPAAGFLLAQVLWGRETQRAEQIMQRLAREDYKPAQAWCREQFIEW